MHAGGRGLRAPAAVVRQGQPMARFLLKRLGLALDHALPAQRASSSSARRSCPETSAAASSARSPTRPRSTPSTSSSAPDRPLSTQYWDWITGFFQGDLGDVARATSVPVSDLIGDALVNSLEARGLRVRARRAARDPRRRRRGAASATGSSTASITLGGLSLTVVPEFVTGIILILVFGLWLDLLPGQRARARRARASSRSSSTSSCPR